MVSADPLPRGARAVPITATPATQPTLADAVSLRPGHALLVRTPDGARRLISDQGLAFPVAGDPEIDALGYRGVSPVAATAELLALLPTGPTLERAAAGRPAPR